MKKKVIINMVVLSVLMSFIGLIAIGIGATNDKNYNENSIICNAVITDIESSSSVNDAYTSYHHRYYGQYVVDGKTYTDIEVLKTETDTKIPDYSIGQTIKVRVIKDNPAKVAERGTAEYIGGVASFGCVILIIVLSLVIYKNIREPIQEKPLIQYESLSEKEKEYVNEVQENFQKINSKIRTSFIFSLIGFFFTIIGCFVKGICSLNFFLQPFYFTIPNLIASIATRKAKNSFKKVPDYYADYCELKHIKNGVLFKKRSIIIFDVLIYITNVFVLYFYIQ